MWDRAFANRLRNELPRWIEEGLLAPNQGEAILARSDAQAAHGLGLIPIALSVIGALTLGTGIILFFAANWEEMTRIAKLAVLFGSMWGAYAVAGRGLSGSARASRVLAQAMLLLGVILFGANIHLIAQIYHIDAHYPNGVLMWSLGALLLAWAVPAEPVAVTGIALATLWSGMEIGEFGRQVHWPFLVVWALFLPPTLYRGWQWASAASVAALGVWCFMLLVNWHWSLGGQRVFLLEIFVLMGTSIQLAGAALHDHPRFAPLSAPVRRTALAGTLLAALGFLSVGIHGLPSWVWGSDGFDPVTWVRKAPATTGQTTLIVAFAAAALVLAILRYRKASAIADSWRNRAGMALAALGAALMLVNPFLPGGYGYVVLMYIAINGTVFAALIWMVAHGYRTGERFQVYSAFAAFGVGLFTLYFIDFWPLMSRSLLIMSGGFVLVAGVYVLETQRRRDTAAGRPA